MTHRLALLTTALALAGCSSATTPGDSAAELVAYETRLAADFDAPPPEVPELDGAPQVVAPATPDAPPRLAPPAVIETIKASFSCDLDVDRTAHGIRITPVVRGGKALTGEYLLVVTKSGRGGSSDISQGGPFHTRAGEKVRLGASEFSMERGARFRAVLKVRADGREICRDVRS